MTFVNDDSKAACQAAGAFDFPSVKGTSFRKGFLLRVKHERSGDISWQPGLRCLRRHMQSIQKTQGFIRGRKAVAFVFLLFIGRAAAEAEGTCYSEGAPNFLSKGEGWEQTHSPPISNAVLMWHCSMDSSFHPDPSQGNFHTDTYILQSYPNSESQQQLRIADLLFNLSKALTQILYVSNVPAWI